MAGQNEVTKVAQRQPGKHILWPDKSNCQYCPPVWTPLPLNKKSLKPISFNGSSGSRQTAAPKIVFLWIYRRFRDPSQASRVLSTFLSQLSCPATTSNYLFLTTLVVSTSPAKHSEKPTGHWSQLPAYHFHPSFHHLFSPLMCFFFVVVCLCVYLFFKRLAHNPK